MTLAPTTVAAAATASLGLDRATAMAASTPTATPIDGTDTACIRSRRWSALVGAAAIDSTIANWSRRCPVVLVTSPR